MSVVVFEVDVGESEGGVDEGGKCGCGEGFEEGGEGGRGGPDEAGIVSWELGAE